MESFLMVCLGNICRSPLAEGILKQKLHDNNLEAIVDSAGTAGYHIGSPPDPRSCHVAQKHGINITDQRCRKFTQTDFDNFDHIFAMDKANYDDICNLTDNHKHHEKVHLILNASFPNKNQEVPDPYYGGESGFEQVFQLLDQSCSIIIDKLKQRL